MNKEMPKGDARLVLKHERIDEAIYNMERIYNGLEGLRDRISNSGSSKESIEEPIPQTSLVNILEHASDRIRSNTEKCLSLVDDIESLLF